MCTNYSRQMQLNPLGLVYWMTEKYGEAELKYDQ